MSEILPWLIPCSIVIVYIVWALAYDRHLQRTGKVGDD